MRPTLFSRKVNYSVVVNAVGFHCDLLLTHEAIIPDLPFFCGLVVAFSLCFFSHTLCIFELRHFEL